MARKSRRPLQSVPSKGKPSAPAAKKPDRLRTGIYARLSLKDLGIENGDTMETQIDIVNIPLHFFFTKVTIQPSG